MSTPAGKRHRWVTVEAAPPVFWRRRCSVCGLDQRCIARDKKDLRRTITVTGASAITGYTVVAPIIPSVVEVREGRKWAKRGAGSCCAVEKETGRVHL